MIYIREAVYQPAFGGLFFFFCLSPFQRHLSLGCYISLIVVIVLVD